MKIAVVICRILLGLLFAGAGLSGFFPINNPPPAPPGLAAVFQDAFFRSRWVLFVDAVQAIAGILLLVNRLVPLALVLLGAVLYNVVAFHVTMMPAGLPMAFVAVLLWGFVAWQYRSSFAPLLAARPRREKV